MAIQDWNGMSLLAMSAEIADEARLILGGSPIRTPESAVTAQDAAFENMTEAKRDAEAIWAEEARLASDQYCHTDPAFPRRG